MIDNHAHSILRDYKNCGLVDFGRPFTESREPAVLTKHLPHTLSYQSMIRQLLSLARLDSLEQYLENRAERDTSEHLGWLFHHAGIEAMLIDDGFAFDCFDISELAGLTSVKLWRVARIENELAKVVLVSDTIEEAVRLLPQAIFNHDQPQVVALKTVMAYRGGLHLEPVSLSQARIAYHPARKDLKVGGRLGRSQAYHYLLAQILEMAAERNLPVQIHCGLGDDDALLADANPLNFQSVLRSERFKNLKAVFLHCYPFVREAAYLASMYSGVYFDLSLTNSLLAPALADIYFEALSAAPLTKILAGSDGHSQPESYWYGASCLRRALHEALQRLRKGAYLGPGQEEAIERAILRGNAHNLYQLG